MKARKDLKLKDAVSILTDNQQQALAEDATSTFCFTYYFCFSVSVFSLSLLSLFDVALDKKKKKKKPETMYRFHNVNLLIMLRPKYLGL